MNVIVKNLLGKNDIDVSDDGAWVQLDSYAKSVQAKLESSEDECVVFDMIGVHYNNPWRNEKFKRLFRNKHIKFMVYNDSKFEDSVNVICNISRLPVERVINVTKEIPVPKTAHQLNNERRIGIFKKAFKLHNGVAELDVCGVCKELTSNEMIINVATAICEFCAENDVGKLMIGMDGAIIQQKKLIDFVNRIKHLEEKGIEINITSNKKDIEGTVSMHKSMEGKVELSDKERADLILAEYPINTPCMYVRYIASKKTDEFGRYGAGEPLISRPAIFKGVRNTKGKYVLNVRTYRCDEFVTKVHYMLKNDNVQMPGLEVEDIEVLVSEMGFREAFIGSKGHISDPIQFSMRDTVNLLDVQDGGSVARSYTIPELMKKVFDEWGIRYDVNMMEIAISRTERFLKEEEMEE